MFKFKISDASGRKRYTLGALEIVSGYNLGALEIVSRYDLGALEIVSVIFLVGDTISRAPNVYLFSGSVTNF